MPPRPSRGGFIKMNLTCVREQGRYAVAQVVFSGRAQVAVVRPSGKLLAMSLLSYATDVKKPSAFEGDLDTPAVSAEERKLAETLIAAATAEEFDLGQFKDEYAGRLADLVEGKAKRTKRRFPGRNGERAVITLM